jgi:hypothetical protein
MYVRHGPLFTDQLIFHHMYKRALMHVHDMNEGDDVSFRFYIWQLGYALFPWTGLVPAGLLWWTRRRDDADNGQGEVSVFLAMWFMFAFALFTAMPTKFHHYIFPAVPPAALLTGILIDRLLGTTNSPESPGASLGFRGLRIELAPRLLLYLAGLGLGSLMLLYGVSRLFPGYVSGFVPDHANVLDSSSPSPVVATSWILLGLGLAIAAAWKFGAFDASHDLPREVARTRQHEDSMLGGIAIAAAIVIGFVGRDLAEEGSRDNVGQARLMHLFTYNYHRQWPDSLEWSGFLTAVTIVAGALCFCLIFMPLRRHAAVMLVATSLAWAVWGLDIYLVKAAPHWGQREVLEAYYRMRGSPDEPVVAYQMNWKGENFYTGNHIPAFVSTGAAFAGWIRAQRERGLKTFWFVTEPSRTSALRSELGAPKVFETVTDKRLNNKFCLVKAVFDS